MEEQHIRLIRNVLARRERKPSGLHDQLLLIKFAYEGGLGVPTICKILEDAGVVEGTSIPNVQGFIRRQQKLGVIREKGSRKEAFDRGMEKAAKLPAAPDTQPPPPPGQAADQKNEGSSGATQSPLSLSESLKSLSASASQTPPPASGDDNPVTKLKRAITKKRP